MHKDKENPFFSSEKAAAADLWTPPEVSGQSINAEQIDALRKPKQSVNVNTPVTAQDLEEIRKAAYQEGFARGQADGKAESKSQQQSIIDSMNTLLSQCQQQLGNFDEQICEQLVTMTISIAKQVIRRELSIEPEQIMAVIRDAINCLPSSSEKLLLKLHPDDAVFVRDIYNLDDEPDRTWKIFEDPGMQRGGCIVNSESSVVNADLDHRIAAIVSQLLGGERNDD